MESEHENMNMDEAVDYEEKGEPFSTEGMSLGPESDAKPEPTRKAVAGSAAGGAALLLAWILSEVGVQMPVEVQAAVAVLVGAGVAYFKREF